MSALATATARDEPVTLALLDAFELRCDGEPVSLPPSAQRLLALLALRERPLLRLHVAGTLWLDTPEERASANLRSSLWRLNRPGPRLVDATSLQLRLAPEVRVDVRETAALAHRLLAASDGADGADVDLDPARLTGELLPDWYDDWVLIELARSSPGCSRTSIRISSPRLPKRRGRSRSSGPSRTTSAWRRRSDCSAR